MHYPMPDAWRQAAQRFLDDRAATDAARDAREFARFQELLRANLEAQGLTVTRVGWAGVDVTYPVGLAVPDDWYEQAREQAFATMAAERAATKGEQGAI